jgi:hypothetical protein
MDVTQQISKAFESGVSSGWVLSSTGGFPLAIISGAPQAPHDEVQTLLPGGRKASFQI